MIHCFEFLQISAGGTVGVICSSNSFLWQTAEHMFIEHMDAARGAKGVQKKHCLPNTGN
jgi:hypothetical protein